MIAWHRVRALILRYVYLYSRNTFRLLDIFFWPFMDLLVWGFVSVYLMNLKTAAAPSAITFLIGAIIFWDILYRAQQAVTISFLEDIWSRNLLNIFIAPVRVSEFIAATYLVGLAQSLIVMAVMGLLARLFYSFDLLSLGFTLIPFFINLLLMGWSMGVSATAMIIRWGQSAEVLAWAIPFLIQPLAAVFYPLSVLPGWLQPISLMFPATHVFEGMREVLRSGVVNNEHLFWAFALNAVYIVGSGLFFNYMYNEARRLGLLAKLGT